MKNQKTVTLTLAPVSLTVSGNSNEELLAQAKLALAEQLKDGVFPHITYGVYDADALTFDTVAAGQIVESNDGKLGIVTGVNKKTIHVTYKNGQSVAGSPQGFKASDATFEEARFERNASYKGDMWFEGTGAYLQNKDGIHEVVIGKITRGKAKLHIVNTTRYFSVAEDLLNKVLKDQKSEFQL